MSTAQHAAERIAATLVETWNRHDAKAFSSIFSPETDFTNVFGMKACGRDEVERFHAPLFATMFRDSHLSAVGMSSRQIRPDVATVDLYWSMNGAYDPKDNAWSDRNGLISLVIAAHDGEWSIECMHNMELDETATAEAQRKLQHERTGTT